MTNNHGGRRPGAGARATITDESMRRTINTIRLPAWMWQWLKNQDGGAGQAVERAVMASITETDQQAMQDLPMINQNPEKRRKRLTREERKEQFVEEAIELAISVNWSAVTQINLATRLSCSPGLILHYWPTVDAFRSEVMRVAVEREIVSIIAQGLGAENAEALVAPRELREQAGEWLINQRGGFNSRLT